MEIEGSGSFQKVEEFMTIFTVVEKFVKSLAKKGLFPCFRSLQGDKGFSQELEGTPLFPLEKSLTQFFSYSEC